MFERPYFALFLSTLVAGGLSAACVASTARAADAVAPSTPLTVPRSTAAAVGPEAKAVARKEGASFLTQLQFKTKSFELGDVARQRLRELLAKAAHAGTIDTIHLIVWSDKEYPSSTRKSLSVDEIRLADRRAKAVNDYFRDHDVKAVVEAYNMAERPNPIQNILSTADARIKRTLEEAGMATTAQDLSRPEYASKAVVLVLLAK